MSLTREVLSDMSADEMLATIKDLDPNQFWYLLVDDGHAISFVFDGVIITDPTLSDCGRFEVDPIKHYGLSPDGAITMQVMNSILSERAK